MSGEETSPSIQDQLIPHQLQQDSSIHSQVMRNSSIPSNRTPSFPNHSFQNTPPPQDPAIDTPTSTFRPRKFSSPFVTFPALNLDELVNDVIDDARSSLVDSGFASSLADHVTCGARLCPKYHLEGLCELGPKCPLIHERKKSSFDPSAPEFHPTQKPNHLSAFGNSPTNSATSGAWNGASDSSAGNSVTGVASKKYEAPRGFKALQLNQSDPGAWSFGADFLETAPESGDRILAKHLTALALNGIDLDPSLDDVEMKGIPFPSDSPPSEVHHLVEERSEGIRALNPLKYKTEPCTTFFTIGACPYGERCYFYHKMEEKSRARSKIKTRLCKSWTATGWCEYGSRCDFAHGCEELTIKFKTRMCKVFFTTGRCPYGAQCTFAHNDGERRRDISSVYKFKTEICRLWLNGSCTYGPVCHFAHGVHELQPAGDLPP